MKRNNWTDNPCYYVSIVDGQKFNVVAGPFRTHQQAIDTVEPAKEVGRKVDPKSHFYAWGTVKLKTGHKEGCLNAHLNI